MKLKPFLLLQLALLGSLALPASAAVITWSAATDVVNTTDVSTNGSTVEAFNLVANATHSTATVTINGVTFNRLTSPAPLTQTLSAAPSQLDGNTSGNADYDSLLNTVALGGGNGTVTMTLGGGNLVNDKIYEIQIWFVEERATTNTRVMTFGDGATGGNTVNLGNTSGLLGQYAIGTFTADGTSQSLTLAPNGFGNSHMTAYQLRLIPEPTTALLGGLGLLALLRRRR